MRFMLSTLISLTTLGLSAGSGQAQKNDEANKARRRAEIQKEIDELQKRIEKLQAELRIEGIWSVGSQGTITRLVFNGIVLGDPGLCYVPDGDTQIMYLDGQKAKPSDLQVGMRVSVHAETQVRALSKPAQVRALVIVIEKGARQIVIEGTDATEIAKQVNFANEYLLLCRIEGVADDELSFTVSRDKQEPFVHFTFHPGRAKGPVGHILTRLYAISKDARVTGYADGKKITSAEELAKALRDRK